MIKPTIKTNTDFITDLTKIPKPDPFLSECVKWKMIAVITREGINKNVENFASSARPKNIDARKKLVFVGDFK